MCDGIVSALKSINIIFQQNLVKLYLADIFWNCLCAYLFINSDTWMISKPSDVLVPNFSMSNVLLPGGTAVLLSHRYKLVKFAIALHFIQIMISCYANLLRFFVFSSGGCERWPPSAGVHGRPTVHRYRWYILLLPSSVHFVFLLIPTPS